MKKLKKILKEEIMKILENDENDDPIAVLRHILYNDVPSSFGELIDLWRENKDNEVFSEYLSKHINDVGFLQPNSELYKQLSGLNYEDEDNFNSRIILFSELHKECVEILEEKKKDFNFILKLEENDVYRFDLYYHFLEGRGQMYVFDLVYDTMIENGSYEEYDQDDEDERLQFEAIENEIRDEIEMDVMESIMYRLREWKQYYGLS